MFVFKQIFKSLFVFLFCLLVPIIVVNAQSCSPSQCYNGSFCEDKPTTNGFYVLQDGKCNVYRYDKCSCTGNGWQCEWVPLSTGGPMSYCEGKSECYVGMRKFQADGCNTKVMNCCNNNTWSDWTGSCGGNCTGDTCWNGSTCRTKPPQPQCSNCLYTANYTCSSGSGW